MSRRSTMNHLRGMPFYVGVAGIALCLASPALGSSCGRPSRPPSGAGRRRLTRRRSRADGGAESRRNPPCTDHR